MARASLTVQQLNRALLARQSLLRPRGNDLPGALEAIGGLQAQYAPAMYVGLWSRVDGFARADLTRALEKRTVVQGTLLRSTIHLVSARDYWPFALAIRQARRDWFLRAIRGRFSNEQYTEVAARLRAALAEGPLRRADIERLVGRDHLSGVGLWLDLVRVPPSGTWERRRADLYAAAEDWLGPPKSTVDAGLELLVRRYLGGFGPAPIRDIADWAGLPNAMVASTVERMGLRRLPTEGGTELHDLPRQPLPDPDVTAPVRFLPTWDATLLVHARRTLILPEEYRPQVFNTKTPHSVPTFLVDGRVAGTWRYESGRITTQEFHPLPASARRELAAEADRLAAFHG